MPSELGRHPIKKPTSRQATTPANPTPFRVQELLDAPNALSPAQSDAYLMFTQRLDDYKRRVKQEAAKYPPPH